MYKQALKMGLKFQTSKGVLTVEQLFQLSNTDIANALKAVSKLLKTSTDDALSFLEDSSNPDVENQLRFDILKDIFLDNKKDAENARTAKARKEHKQKILALIAMKEEEALRNLSKYELRKLLQEEEEK